jgi:hypothetical protein
MFLKFRYRLGYESLDTTVVGANVAYPTNSGLLTKAIGRLTVLVRRVQAAGGATRTGFETGVVRRAGGRGRSTQSYGFAWVTRGLRCCVSPASWSSSPAWPAQTPGGYPVLAGLLRHVIGLLHLTQDCLPCGQRSKILEAYRRQCRILLAGMASQTAKALELHKA